MAGYSAELYSYPILSYRSANLDSKQSLFLLGGGVYSVCSPKAEQFPLISRLSGGGGGGAEETNFLSHFEKNSSLVGLKIGRCIFLCMYGLCHTNQIEATILPCKVIHQ